MAKSFAEWVLHSSKIGEFLRLSYLWVDLHGCDPLLGQVYFRRVLPFDGRIPHLPSLLDELVLGQLAVVNVRLVLVTFLLHGAQLNLENGKLKEHQTIGSIFIYFLRFARVITSFSCTWFLRKLAPTLHIHIYWVQANIMSMGKLGAWVQLPVITLAKPRK